MIETHPSVIIEPQPNLTEQEYSDQGYLAAILDENSQKKLMSLARFSKIFCHHLTIAFQPTEEVWNKYKHLLGKSIIFNTTGFTEDEKAQAVRVDGPSENKYPHITISCRDEVSPIYSNELITNHLGQEKPLTEALTAKVDFIPFESR